MGGGRWGGGGGCIFIYSCSARRISFESDCFYGISTSRVGSSEVVVVRYCSELPFSSSHKFLTTFFKTVAVAIANYILPKSSQVVDYFSNSESHSLLFKIVSNLIE